MSEAVAVGGGGTGPEQPETTDTASVSSETTDTASVSSETTDTAPVSSETTDTAPVSSETTDTALVSSETTHTAPVSSETTDTAPVSSETTDTAPVSSAPVSAPPLTPLLISTGTKLEPLVLDQGSVLVPLTIASPGTLLTPLFINDGTTLKTLSIASGSTLTPLILSSDAAPPALIVSFGSIITPLPISPVTSIGGLSLAPGVQTSTAELLSDLKIMRSIRKTSLLSAELPLLKVQTTSGANGGWFPEWQRNVFSSRCMIQPPNFFQEYRKTIASNACSLHTLVKSSDELAKGYRKVMQTEFDAELNKYTSTIDTAQQQSMFNHLLDVQQKQDFESYFERCHREFHLKLAEMLSKLSDETATMLQAGAGTSDQTPMSVVEAHLHYKIEKRNESGALAHRSFFMPP